jgi:hypothetical protein
MIACLCFAESTWLGVSCIEKRWYHEQRCPRPCEMAVFFYRLKEYYEYVAQPL